MDDDGRTGRVLHEFGFPSGDLLALRKAVIDPEAFELYSPTRFGSETSLLEIAFDGLAIAHSVTA